MEPNGKRGVASKQPAARARTPRHIILLAGDDHSQAERVLIEYPAQEAHTANLSEDLQRFAEEYRGRTIAAEWQGPREWVRFLWCRKERGDSSAVYGA
jgi:hypothetical protein